MRIVVSRAVRLVSRVIQVNRLARVNEPKLLLMSLLPSRAEPSRFSVSSAPSSSVLPESKTFEVRTRVIMYCCCCCVVVLRPR